MEIKSQQAHWKRRQKVFLLECPPNSPGQPQSGQQLPSVQDDLGFSDRPLGRELLGPSSQPLPLTLPKQERERGQRSCITHLRVPLAPFQYCAAAQLMEGRGRQGSART